MGKDRKRQIAGVFVALIVAFPMQYLFARTFGEPYPALMMPAFSGARLNSEGRVGVLRARVVWHLDGALTNEMTLRRLFEKAPSSHFEAMARNALLPRAQPLPKSGLWGTTPLKEMVLRKVLPGYVLNRVRSRYWEGVSPDVVQWLKQRGKELHPDNPPKGVEVIWQREQFTWEHGSTPVSVTFQTNLTVSF